MRIDHEKMASYVKVHRHTSLHCIAASIHLFDIIDWIIPGSFPNWVYVAEEAVWVAIGVASLVMLIKKACKQRKEDMKKK